MTDREFDLLLRSALLERNREELEEAKHLDPIEPSPRYLRWRMKFLADPFRYGKKHTRPLWRKVLRVALSAVLVIVLTFGAVLAVYPPARQWVARWFETYTSFTLPGTSSGYRTPDGLCLDYLPEGFEPSEQIVSGVRIILTFTNPDAQVIRLQYSPQESSNFLFDNEHQTYQEIILDDGTSAILMVANDGGDFNSLTWVDSNIEVAFALIGECDSNELVKMANSIHA